MLVLFMATFGDYKNFAPTFSVAVFVVILSSVTLLLALFTAFGRKSFWARIPQVGDSEVKASSLWIHLGRFVTKKSILSVVIIFLFFLLSVSYVFYISDI